jgi:hypothetical protein
MAGRHVAHDGTVLTDELLDQWGDQIEAGEYPGTAVPVRRGRPLAIGAEAASPVTVWLDRARRDKLRLMAERRHVSQAEVLRDLLDAAAV